MADNILQRFTRSATVHHRAEISELTVAGFESVAHEQGFVNVTRAGAASFGEQQSGVVPGGFDARILEPVGRFGQHLPECFDAHAR